MIGVALAMTAFGSLTTITALPAAADVTTPDYAITAAAQATVSPTTVVVGADTSWTVAFTTPAALGSGATLTIGDNEGNAVAGTAPAATAYLLSGACLDTDAATASPSSGLVFTVNCSSGISAGATVEIVFEANAPTSDFYFEVSTSANGVPVDTNLVTTTSTPPTLGASTLVPGVGATYTITDAGASRATGGSWSTLAQSATSIELVSQGQGASPVPISWFTGGGASGYTVTYTPPHGTATADAVSAVNASSAGAVYLDLASAVPEGSTVNITADGVNPTVSGVSDYVEVTPGVVTSGSSFTTSGTEPFTSVGPTETTGSLTFALPVASATLSLSSTVGGATGVTYTLSFVASAAVAASTGTITISEISGPTDFSAVAS